MRCHPSRRPSRAAAAGARPLDLDVRNLACHLAVTVDGEREVLGMWWQETEGAKFWLASSTTCAGAASRTC